MPPKRKASSDNPVERRKRLATRIESGVVTMRPCRPCQNATPPRQCRVSSDSGVCQHCARSNNPNCDLVVTDRDWEKIDNAVIKLQHEILEAEETIAIASAKLLRLRKQLKFQSSREKQLVERELQNIAELEADQEAARQSATAVIADPLTELPESFWLELSQNPLPSLDN